MKEKIFISIIILSVLFSAGCRDREDFPDPPYVYFDAVGTGYVFEVDNMGILRPVQGAQIIVQTYSGTGGLFSWAPDVPERQYVTDKNGFYQVKFIKSVYTKGFMDGTAVYYSHTYYFEHEDKRFCRISAEEVRYAKETVLIDTLIIGQPPRIFTSCLEPHRNPCPN